MPVIKWIAVLLCLIQLTACGSSSKDDDSLSGEQLTEARRLFTYWCSGCHGVDATGNGPRPNIVGKTVEQIDYAFNNVPDMSSLAAVVSSTDVEKISAYLKYLQQNLSATASRQTIEIVDAKATYLITNVDSTGELEIPQSMFPPLLIRKSLIKKYHSSDQINIEYGFALSNQLICIDQHSNDQLQQYTEGYGGLTALFKQAREQGASQAMPWQQLLHCAPYINMEIVD